MYMRVFFALPLISQVISRCFEPSLPFPSPSLRLDDPSILSLFSGLETKIQNAIAVPRPEWNTTITSFSIQVTSAEDTIWELYHTAPLLGKYTDSRPTDVSGKTYFRIASISKVFTVLAILIQEKAGRLNIKDPISKYIPELKQNSDDGIQWDKISIESLATQLSGIPREYGQNDLTDAYTANYFGFSNPLDNGLPPVYDDEAPTCGRNRNKEKPCSKEELINGFRKRNPVFVPNFESSYSNVAFVLLGFVIENVTKLSYEEAIAVTILEPLGIKGASFEKPKDSEGVIPATTNDWSYHMGVYKPTGGMYASASELSIFLRSILTPKLLDVPATNAWLQPHSYSSNLYSTYGMPWEITRTTSILADTDRGMMLYAKAGNLDGYSSHIILVPEYGIGFTLLVAGDGKALKWIEDQVLTTTIQGIENIAREQVRQQYAGSYHAPLSTGINSSLILSLDGSSGLVVTSWISNGTDFLPKYASFSSEKPGKAQLIPSRLKRGAAGEVWRLTFVQPDVKPKSVVDTCQMNDVDSIMYGGRSMDEFVFLKDRNGVVQGVELSAFRITLAKFPEKKIEGESEANSRSRNMKPLNAGAADL